MGWERVRVTLVQIVCGVGDWEGRKLNWQPSSNGEWGTHACAHPSDM